MTIQYVLYTRCKCSGKAEEERNKAQTKGNKRKVRRKGRMKK
jgi:hypothetical protein